jgi:hypothetical protein
MTPDDLVLSETPYCKPSQSFPPEIQDIPMSRQR